MIQSKFKLMDSSDPVIAMAIHNGNKIPQALQPYMAISEEDRLREEDPFTGKIADHFSNSIVVESSRFAADLNRRRESAVYLEPKDAWGLTVRSSDYPSTMTPLLLSSYDNWYNALSYQIERLLQIHPFLYILDLHSYNHRREGADAPPDPQSENPDIILGRSNMPEELYPLVEILRQGLDGQVFMDSRLDCRVDVKFPGGNWRVFCMINIQQS